MRRSRLTVHLAGRDPSEFTRNPDGHDEEQHRPPLEQMADIDVELAEPTRRAFTSAWNAWSVELDLTLDEVAEHLALRDRGERPCKYVLELAHRRIGELDERITAMRQAREEELEACWPRPPPARMRPAPAA